MPLPAAIPLLLKAAPYMLQGASLMGGIFGKKRKHIDPEMLRQKFGPRAAAQDAQEIAQYILNSPYGQQLMASAAEQGQTFQTEMAGRAAQSGLDPSSGGQSGASDFAMSGAAGAQSGFERATKGNIYQSAMPIAADMVAQRQQAYINDLQSGGYQDDKASMWQGVGKAAGIAAAAIPQGGAKPTTSLPTQALADAANMQQPQVAPRVVAAGARPQIAPITGMARQPAMESALMGNNVQRNSSLRRRV